MIKDSSSDKLNQLTTPVKSISINDFGRLIELKNNKLIAEKKRRYSYIESDGKTLTPLSNEVSFTESDEGELKMIEESMFKSPPTIEKSTSIFSSGSSKKYKRNIFLNNETLRKKLPFNKKLNLIDNVYSVNQSEEHNKLACKVNDNSTIFQLLKKRRESDSKDC